MAGFFDLAVNGITVTGCKAFQKEDKVWFAWPAEKTQDKEGNDHWREIVTASEPVMRHLQGLIRSQLRAAILGNAGGNQPRKPAGGHSRSGDHGDRAYQESRRAAQTADDIHF
jgi:hypothetical protein